MGTMLSAALRLADKGLAIFPCQPAGKTPACSHGVKDATRDHNLIEGWWSHVPTLNVGIATGRISGVLVIDVDSEEAEVALRQLESDHGALPPTVEAITGKGRHIYLQAPDRQLGNSVAKIAPGIDSRGDGGYVLAPPSLHPSGKRYAWSVDSAAAIAPAPDWLIEKLASSNGANGAIAAVPGAAWHALLHDGIAEGGRNNAVARLCGHLLRRRVDALVVLEICSLFNAQRCRPPLDHAELVQICNSIAGKELKRRTAQ